MQCKKAIIYSGQIIGHGVCCFLTNCCNLSCYALSFSWCSRNNPFAYTLMTVHLFPPRAFSMTECLPRPGRKLLHPFESRSRDQASLNQMKGHYLKFSKCLIGCLALPHVVNHLPPGRGQSFGYSKCEGDRGGTIQKPQGVVEAATVVGSCFLIQTHLWFLSRKPELQTPVSQPRLGSLQKALIVLQYITVFAVFKKKHIEFWHETSKLILSAAWKGYRPQFLEVKS